MIQAKLMQMILFVREMDRSVHFYRDVLGLEVVYPQAPLEDYASEMWVEFDAGGCALALHGGAKKPTEDSHEVIFKVEDLVQARQEILKAGIQIAEIRLLEDGAPIAEGVDPDGHRFAIR
ncbi:MAG: VOC family protein [Brevefilum sp.]|nr:VOC family protein [Brevefilum sp.]